MSSDPLHVVLVSTQRGWYGGEEQAALLCSGLRDRGLRVTVAAVDGGRFGPEMRRRGFETSTLRGAGSGAVVPLRRLLRSLRPDVVHANDPRALTAVGLAMTGSAKPLRVASRRVVFRPRSPWAYRRWCDCLVCVSDAVRVACRDAGIPESLLTVVHDGVDPGRIAAGVRRRGRRALRVATEESAIVSVASLTPCKGHSVLIEAFARLQATLPAARLFLAGEGELRGPLQQQVRQAGLESRVHLLGYRDDVADVILAADLVVLASTQEGQGSSLIEAMLARRPTVATNAGGIPELLGPDDAGDLAWLVPRGDAAALAAAIAAAFSDPAEAAARAERAHRRATGGFLAAHMVDRTLALYEQALAGR